MYKASSSILLDFAKASISPVILMDLTLSEVDLGTIQFEFNSTNEAPVGAVFVAARRTAGVGCSAAASGERATATVLPELFEPHASIANVCSCCRIVFDQNFNR